jgi:aminoglycoside phosphotransferase (APT) family kinase protein
VLERLDAWPLHYHGLDSWLAAARRLAELHARFASPSPRDFLLRLNEAYLTAWAERAVAAVGRSYSVDLGQRLERLVSAWQRVIEAIVAQPLTLVHNDLSRKNVLVARAGRPPRLCFVDWEMAGVGCGLLDLVHLRYQRLDPEGDRRLLAEYARALGGTGLLPAGPRLRRLFAACELHRTVYRLARCAHWAKPLDYVADRVAAAERLWESLR